MGRSVLIWLIAAGCGRIGFDPTGNGPGGDDGGAVPRSCPRAETAPDPIMVSGTALRVTVIGIYPESGVTVSVASIDNGPSLASMTTDASGNFSLAVPTGAVPIKTFISLSRADLLTSLFVPDEEIDRDLTGTDGFVANDNATNQLYTVPSPNLTRDTTKGTLLVRVLDCAGNGISGATIALTPPAEKIIYATSAGLPSSTPTMTSSTGQAWALNAPAGVVQLTAAKSGLTFVPHDVNIRAGSFFMGSQMRPVTP